MRIRSRSRLAGGTLLALAMPLLYWVLTVLITNGIVSIERSGPIFWYLFNLESSAFTQVILELVGIGIIGRSIGLERAGAWLLLYILAVPLMGLLWFLTYASFGGAMGSPF